MLLISCPHCGPRTETEFRCAGPVRHPRNHFVDASDGEWIEYLCYTDNHRGVLEENWCHEKGCGEWFRLRRNTITHEIIEVD